jgi:hypothetical protein
MVDAEPVRVPVEQRDRARVGPHLLLEGGERLVEAAATRAPRGPIEARIGLEQHRDAERLFGARERKALRQPSDVRRCARRVFAVHLGCAPAVVSAPHDVQADELHAARAPAHVLRIAGLALERHPLPTQALRFRREKHAQAGQPLERVEAAGVAIGPFVVAEQEHEGMRRAIEQRAAPEEQVVAARRAARLEIADVHDERERKRVERGQELAEQPDLDRVVRQIPDQRELEWLGGWRDKQARGEERGDELHVPLRTAANSRRRRDTTPPARGRRA